MLRIVYRSDVVKFWRLKDVLVDHVAKFGWQSVWEEEGLGWGGLIGCGCGHGGSGSQVVGDMWCVKLQDEVEYVRV